MPELPEVETLRQELMSAVKGKTFADVFCNSPKQISPKLEEFKKLIKSRQIKEVERRAKMLIFELGPDLFLVIHLKLTGQLIFKSKVPATSAGRRRPKSKVVYGGHPQPGGTDNLPNKFTHIYFTFIDGAKLYFNDLRKFGWARLVNSETLQKVESEFGVEPLSAEFTLEVLKKILARRQNKKIKLVLMEQELIAGIGNIYADESCFCAKILPMRLVRSLTAGEVAKLHQCIPEILKFAISKKGTSADTYVQLTGEPGGMMPHLKVYGREGEKCKICGGIIKKIKLGGRGTHFCPGCQK